MEFKSLTNIESSFKRIRLMLAVFACCCALVTGYEL
ncbi:conjugative transposon protein TraK, partial [Bacteroides ovatus]